MAFHPNSPSRGPPWGVGSFGASRFGQKEGISEERLERIVRVEPYLNVLKDGMVPDISTEQLLQLTKDLKEEGNAIFTEKSYMEAAEMYWFGLIIGRHLQTQHFVEVDRGLLSALFCNRAFCCLKMDMWKQAMEDCDFAISLKRDNIKAFYRKAMALKYTRDYSQALKVASEGREKAQDNSKTKEIKDFDELIRELNSHLNDPGQEKKQPKVNGSSGQKKSSNSGKEKESKTKKQAPHSPQRKKSEKKSAVVSAKTSMKLTGGADATWLDGTNAMSKKPPNEPVTKKDKVKKPKAPSGNMMNNFAEFSSPSKTQYKGRFATLQDQDDNSSESYDSSTDTSEEELEECRIPAPVKMPSVTAKEVPAFLKKGSKGVLKTDTGPLDDLDDFGEVHNNNVIPAGFSPIHSTEPVSLPFISQYDFTLVCAKCYPYDGSGAMGFRAKPSLQHQCDADTLLIRPQTGYTAWVKVRPRPVPKTIFSGRYKLCQQFSTGQPCRVAEAQCSFGHYQEELELWEMDQKGQINIAEFIDDQRAKLKTGKSLRLYGSAIPVSQPINHASYSPSSASFVPGKSKTFTNSEATSSPAPSISTFNPPATLWSPASNPSKATTQQTSWAEMAETVPINIPPPPLNLASGYTPGYTFGAAQGQQGSAETKSIVIKFPMADTHIYTLACTQCFRCCNLGVFIKLKLPHRCAEDVLGVQLKGETVWVKIRERLRHRPFKGNYILCRYQCGPHPQICPVPDEGCMFAHNMPEQILWTFEKDGKFNVTEFMLQCRSNGQRPGFSLEGLLSKHPGRFIFLCRACFFENSQICGEHPQHPGLCSAIVHAWEATRQLMHFSLEGRLTPIEHRPFQHKSAFFLLCNRMQYCMRRKVSRCTFAHSLVERDVWLVERDSEISRDALVASSLLNNHSLERAPPSASTSTSSRSTPSVESSTPTVMSTNHKPGELAAGLHSSLTLTPAPPPAKPRCPHKIMVVCGICKKSGKYSERDGTKDRCKSKAGPHMWTTNETYIILPSRQTLKPLPKRIPSGKKFIICRHIREKKKCDYTLGGFCQFAHSQAEIDIWTYMVDYNLPTLQALVESCQSAPVAQPEPIPVKTISQGESVVTTWKLPAAPQPVQNTTSTSLVFKGVDLSMNSHYCSYCSVQCNSTKQWDEHCASEKHMFNVNTDREHQWNYRQPPWGGVASGNYQLCMLHEQGRCRYTEMPDMYNACLYAHSLEELDEWKERWEWRQMKREIARKEHVFSYMDTLLEEYENTADGINVLSEECSAISIECDNSQSVYRQEKSATLSWVFTIVVKDKRTLQKVALLHNKDRLHFCLTDDEFRSCQIASGDIYHRTNTTARAQAVYRVEVKFVGGIFGSFSQWVVFDFGTRPVLVRKLNVELGTQFVQDKVKTLRENLHFDRWTGDNRTIVYFDTHAPDRDLLKAFKPPTSAGSVINQQSMGVELNRHNYAHKMHQLLYLEELTQAKIIANFNVVADLEVMKCVQENVFLYARPGELFAKVPLNDQLSEDTDAGKLILSSVSTVMLAPQDTLSNRVYEAIIVNKENFDFDGKCSDYIYLCLPPQCCQELELLDGSTFTVEIQFQMNRIPFCDMHHAIDLFEQTNFCDVAFPDMSKANLSWHNQPTVRIQSEVLNTDQLKIVHHVLSAGQDYSPPLIIYGPFGTGKTETLAQAAMALIQHRPGARILICTHSNSAADLFITKHLEAFADKTAPDLKMLRLYFIERRINTVNPVVRKFCHYTADKSAFAFPTVHDILSQKIVITTLSTSLKLASMPELRGKFTHIMLDEAAQALECEAIMPLCLATEKTCIVLAGDHIQMSKKVYSKEATQQKFHKSLLERLFRHYEFFKNHAEGRQTPSILLSINYRTKMEILRFISAIFYGGPERLLSRCGLPDVEGVVPLTFYVAQGREKQEIDSTSYYNMAEIEELTDRVDELCQAWPEEWGPFSGDQIGVVSPYTDQVNRIRTSLRRRRKELRSVVVERLMNMQGKEFRVVFISTVRTTHLAENPSQIPSTISECDGDYGDFGFLSDQKLLNTAFTRARSMVAVVGDPVALCAIGDCINIWRAFLKHCTKLKSIYPSTVSLDTVRMQVVSMMNSPLGQNLMRLATLQKEDQNQSALAMLQSGADGGKAFPNPSDYKPENVVQQVTENVQTADDTTPALMEDWSGGFQIEADDIIKQLAKDAVKSHANCARNQKMKNAANSDEPLKLECIIVEPEEGHAVIHYFSPTRSTQKRHLLTDADSAMAFDSDHDLSDDETIAGRRPVYTDFTPQQLNDFIRTQSDRYKHCILHIGSSRHIYAKPVDPNCSVKEISISSRIRCGRGFDNDEVVVELLSPDEEDSQALSEEGKGVIHGQVIGILHRAINPKYRMFVCMVEQGNTGLMVPLNRGIPKIYNVETTNRLNKTKKGHVCVYTFTKDREVIFHHYEPVDPAETTKLFIVRYLKWDYKFYSPLGVVVGVIPSGNTVEDGMKILEIEHSIPKRFKAELLAEVERAFPPHYTIPDRALIGRLDYRDKLVFSIDPAESRDLDDALSMEQRQDGTLVVGVHIADVAHYVQPGCALDNEAESRGSSFYRLGQDPVPMLPDRLSGALCSLLPGQDRLALSVFITLSMRAEVLSVQPKRTIIRSKHRLDYEEAESILIPGLYSESSTELPQTLKINVMFLYKIAKIWREQRLGLFPAQYQPLDPDCIHTPKAHLLVEEIMIMANHQIALYLLNAFPSKVPLRVQGAPCDEELQEWKAQFAQIAHNTVGLSNPFLHPGLKCTCQGQCECVSPTERAAAPPLNFVNIKQELWNQITQWVFPDPQISRVKAAILPPENHPQMALGLLALRSLQQKSQYQCSGDCPEKRQSHHALNLLAYCHFTSPIRRYMDLVTHRMLGAAINNQPCPYSNEDITAICARMTDVSVKVSRYDLAVRSLHLTSLLQQLPLVLNPILEKFDDRGLQLRFPTLREMPLSRSLVPYNNLGPSEVPHVDEVSQVISIKWQSRIYDTQRPELDPSEVVQYDSGQVIQLNPSRFVYHIPIDVWRLLLHAAVQDLINMIMEATGSASCSLIDGAANPSYSPDVTSEAKNLRTASHFVDYQLELQPSSLLQVQVVAESYKGLLTPSLQLLNLTPTLDICLEHRNNPIRCFATMVNTAASKPYYRDVASYKNSWLPVAALEAAHCAVSSDVSAIIHNVDIKWQEESGITGETYRGVLSLPLQFCMEREIRFSCDRVKDSSVPEEVLTNTNSALTYDYVCVRYANIKPEPPSNIMLLEKFDLRVKPSHWVGHCLTTGVSINKEKGMLNVELKLHQNSIKFPRELLIQPRPATIEWIPKSLPDKRVVVALNALDIATPLAQTIAIGRAVPDLDALVVQIGKEVVKCDVPNLPNPNPGQETAILSALTHTFSLIQGPPGTGKTVTGVRLAYLFSKINELLPMTYSKEGVKPQVLYCGPSNKSVDVVAGYLLRLGAGCCRIVRVYSEVIEQLEFPRPNDTMSVRQRRLAGERGTEPHLKPVTLHHIIRDPGRLHGNEILEMDARIRATPKEIAYDEIQEYQRIISKAEVENLQMADIILCTCTTSSAPRIYMNCNIQQVIIDEAGMCTEPETILPIVTCGAQQVVLIGDHQQLRPIIKEDTSRLLGLETSLFERYSEKAFMLTEQYRMHEAISTFPSQYFYGDKLKTATSDQSKVSSLKFWPNGRNKPITFVHVVGCELTQSVSTSEGSLMSKSNLEEASQAVRAATLLVRRFHVRPQDVVVLSQYRAQCAEIERQLLQRGEKDITVSTVVASQGSEWEYVVLSTVRSLPKLEIEKNPTIGWRRKNLGFIMDVHQINVAITRAKKGLIILGNKYLLQCDPMWKKLLEHYKVQKKVVSAAEFMA